MRKLVFLIYSIFISTAVVAKADLSDSVVYVRSRNYVLAKVLYWHTKEYAATKGNESEKKGQKVFADTLKNWKIGDTTSIDFIKGLLAGHEFRVASNLIDKIKCIDKPPKIARTDYSWVILSCVSRMAAEREMIVDTNELSKIFLDLLRYTCTPAYYEDTSTSGSGRSHEKNEQNGQQQKPLPSIHLNGPHVWIAAFISILSVLTFGLFIRERLKRNRKQKSPHGSRSKHNAISATHRRYLSIPDDTTQPFFLQKDISDGTENICHFELKSDTDDKTTYQINKHEERINELIRRQQDLQYFLVIVGDVPDVYISGAYEMFTEAVGILENQEVDGQRVLHVATTLKVRFVKKQEKFPHDTKVYADSINDGRFVINEHLADSLFELTINDSNSPHGNSAKFKFISEDTLLECIKNDEYKKISGAIEELNDRPSDANDIESVDQSSIYGEAKLVDGNWRVAHKIGVTFKVKKAEKPLGNESELPRPLTLVYFGLPENAIFPDYVVFSTHRRGVTLFEAVVNPSEKESASLYLVDDDSVLKWFKASDIDQVRSACDFLNNPSQETAKVVTDTPGKLHFISGNWVVKERAKVKFYS